MRGIGCREYGRPRGDALLGPAVVHIGGRQQPEADAEDEAQEPANPARKRKSA